MGPWQPIAAWATLILAAIVYETWALNQKGNLTLSEGVWNVTRRLAQAYPYCLTLLGFVIGVFFGHFFYCPCELR